MLRWRGVYSMHADTGIFNKNLLDSRPSHFISFGLAIWCAPSLLCWGTSYWVVLMFSRMFKPPMGVVPFLLDTGRLLPSLFSPIFVHFLWARCASALVRVQVLPSVHYTSITFGPWYRCSTLAALFCLVLYMPLWPSILHCFLVLMHHNRQSMLYYCVQHSH